MRSNTLLTAVMLTLISAGCLETEEYEIGILSEEVKMPNDSQFNAAKFNGIRFNGIRFNGIRFNGIRFNGVSLSGTKFSGTEEFTAIAKSGGDFAGTTMEAVLSNGTVVTLHVQEVREIGAAGSGLFAYRVEYADPSNGGAMTNICSDEEWAIPVDSTWNEESGTLLAVGTTEFSFACRGAALAKCVEWGYKDKGDVSFVNPSNGQTRKLSLSDFHQACTRMVRADYCGNGVAHTKNGTLIDVFDDVDIMEPTPQAQLPANFSLEAEWTKGGGRCIQHTRFQGTNPSLSKSDLQYIQDTCPSRLAANNTATCGNMNATDFFISNNYDAPSSTRALLRNVSANNALY